MSSSLRCYCLILLATGLTVQNAFAQPELENPPIRYYARSATDPVAKLKNRIKKGEVKLEWNEQFGWLPSILKALKVPEESQTLVFSKTSLQLSRIHPGQPRAIYFNDDVYVGWVRNGDIELAAADSELGATFYRVGNRAESVLEITRDQDNCLSCHMSSRTKNVPGFLVRSVFPERSGHPRYQLGTKTVDHTSDFSDCFGGWYVTGRHGMLRHRGNVLANGDGPNPLDRESGSNLDKLPERVDADDYLQPGSDIVALMLLQHQSQMHNLITQSLYTEKKAIHQQKTMNRILERPEEYQSENTQRRIESAADKLIEYLFFCDEFALTSRISGSPGFQNRFLSQAIRDPKGRSLRDLDLEKRMFRYPCSYMIYTETFRSLPSKTLAYVKKRMLQILRGEERSEKFQHLSKKDRKNILEILEATHPLFRK